MPGREYKRSYRKSYRKRYKKKGYKMSKMVKKPYKGIGNYYFRRMGYKPSITGVNPSVVQFAAYTFFISEMIAYNEFTNLFDQYVIEKVDVKLKLLYDPSAQTANHAIYPILYYRKDYDDDTLPISVDEFRQCQDTGSVCLNPNKFTTITLKPRAQAAMYNPTVNAYSPKTYSWIDCNYANAPHYGLKFAVERLATGMTLTVDTVYYVRFRAPR